MSFRTYIILVQYHMKFKHFGGFLFWRSFEIPNLIYFFSLESGVELTFTLSFNVDGEDMVSRFLIFYNIFLFCKIYLSSYLHFLLHYSRASKTKCLACYIFLTSFFSFYSFLFCQFKFFTQLFYSGRKKLRY